MATVAAILAGAVGGWLVDLFLANSYRRNSILGHPTRCTRCQARAGEDEFIPLVGGFIRIRCSECKARLWPRFILSVAAGAASFAVCYIEYGSIHQALIGGVFCLVFLALTLTDLEQRLLPDRIVLSGIIVAICTAWLLPDMAIGDVLWGGGLALLVAIGMLLLSLPFGGGAVGMGDLKVVVLMGFLLGPQSLVVAVLIAMISASAVALLLLLLRLRRFGDYIPHGPFLAVGSVVALWWGTELFDWYSK